MSAPWFAGRMAPFDLETTGTDPEEARIVQAYVGLCGGDLAPMDVVDLIVDPGVEITNSEIHKISNERARAEGVQASRAVHTIAEALAVALAEGIPLVGHNITYDITVIDRECHRHGLPTVADRLGRDIAPVLCTQTLSKHVDKFRRKSTDINPRTREPYGAQQLRTTAIAFGVPWDDEQAHGARYDAMVSARVAYKIGTIAAQPLHERDEPQGRCPERFDELRVPLARLHAAQQRWAAAQARSSAAYWRKQAERSKDVDEQIELRARADRCTGAWPLIPRTP